MKIIITSRLQAGKILTSSSKYKGITHVVSIGSNKPWDTLPYGFDIHSAKKLRLVFDDVTWSRMDKKWGELKAPQESDIERLIDFYTEVLQDESEKHFLIHCFAGISRSSASALLLLAIQFGPENERAAILELMKISPSARPNALIVAHGDKIMSRNGALIDALADYNCGLYK